MDKPTNCVRCAVAFLIACVVVVSLFGLFSAWAWSALSPAQQEVIGAINTPWISAQRDPALVPSKADAPAGQGAGKARPVRISTTAKSGP